jgi:hypothetical protein
MRLILTYEEAVTIGLGIWIGWKILRGSIRFGYEWLLISRWKRRAWPRRVKESES